MKACIAAGAVTVPFVLLLFPFLFIPAHMVRLPQLHQAEDGFHCDQDCHRRRRRYRQASRYEEAEEEGFETVSASLFVTSRLARFRGVAACDDLVVQQTSTESKRTREGFADCFLSLRQRKIALLLSLCSFARVYER